MCGSGPWECLYKGSVSIKGMSLEGECPVWEFLYKANLSVRGKSMRGKSL